MFKENLAKAYDMIRAAERVLLVTHDRPDGDAVASVCAMLEILDKEGVDNLVFCKDRPAEIFDYLEGTERFSNDRGSLGFDRFDLIITLDCGSLGKTHLAEEIAGRRPDQKVIEIDHHPKLADYADLEIRDHAAASTTEVLYHFVRHNRIKFSRNLANCILTGLLTDTGNFLYPSTSDQTVKIGSEMLKYGARFPKIVENTLRNKSIEGMKLWGAALNSLEINKRYNFAFSVLTRKELEASGVGEEELDGMAGFLSNLYGVRGILLLREEEDGQIKGSLRTAKPGIDISKLALKLGGGGHARASGFLIKGKLRREAGKWQIS
jgi:bifunctional oligoribonuclease and PAP phosphatase NrnA